MSDRSFHSLDELLESPFERIETEQPPTTLERIEAMERKLQELDDDLTEYLDRSSCVVQ